jgi:hypothetical protein
MATSAPLPDEGEPRLGPVSLPVDRLLPVTPAGNRATYHHA